MQSHSRSNKLLQMNRYVISALMFVLVAGLGVYWSHISQRAIDNEQRLLMNEIVNAQAATIERRLAQALSSTRIMAVEVKQQHGMIHDFDSYAAEVLLSVGGVSNLQLAPGGVIEKIYPLKGNEKALGHNILKDDSRRQEALLAIEERHLTLAGPFELIQGGVAVIGRNPVFLGPPGDDAFWGFTSALIFLDDLLAVTELNQLQSKGYRYQLTRNHPDTGQPDLISASEKPVSGIQQAINIKVPNAVWTLTMSRPAPRADWMTGLAYLVSLLAGLLTAWIVSFVLQQPEKLKEIVRQKTAELEELAFYDHLTGLANRRLLIEQLTQVIRQSARDKHAAALLYLDLDDFKRVNDSLGHEAGDRLLKNISDRLTSIVRESDIVARLGGDEFAVLLIDAKSLRDVSRIAEKLIEQIEKPVPLDNKEFIVSTSVGITMIPTDGHDATTLLSNADIAMYAAKRAGKRNFRFFDQAMQTKALEKMQVEEDLIVAISQNQFVLHYQPLLNLSDNSLCSFEALIRWQHSESSLLYPDKFISIAEETGKIVDIGYWVIREACKTIKARAVDHDKRQRIAVNLSPRQFNDPDLLVNIRDIVRSENIDARSLEIEVTESTLMKDISVAIEVLSELKSMGITITIDDFGTGYSSLAILKQLPVDKLKIDRSFVMDLESDRNDQEIVRGLIAIAHTLKIKVVAEGIETKAQCRLLREYGCDFGQGFLFSKPLPIQAFQTKQVFSVKSEVATQS